jgi:hypothetical protein
MGAKHSVAALAGAFTALVGPSAARAQDPPTSSGDTAAAGAASGAEKSGYDWLDPTPRALMREMATDRPDTTESPISVDAGHLQAEVEALGYARDAGSTDVIVAAMNLKLGLTSRSDLQVVVEPLHHSEGRTGVGDLTLRNKWNLWGNDGGATAFGLMPFITLPTASNDFGSGYVEGGLIAPFAFEAPLGFECAVMLELDAVRRAERYGADLVATATTGHDLYADLGGFFELTSSFPLDAEGEPAFGANSGLTLGLSDDLVVDGGVRLGLNDAAEDLSLFLGGSVRY